MNKEQKLFDLLIKFGFEKTEDNKKIVFKKDDEIFVYPPTKLQKHHYMATRKHLDMNNWIKKSEFDLIFNKGKKRKVFKDPSGPDQNTGRGGPDD